MVSNYAFSNYAGGRGRLQGKHWFSHQYQCDVTSHIGEFQYGGRLRRTILSEKWVFSHDLDDSVTVVDVT